jgi:hypothetical protein
LSNACANSAKFPALSLIKPGQVSSSPSHHPLREKRKDKIMFIDDLEGICELHLQQLSRTLKYLDRGIFILTCSDWFNICRAIKGFKELDFVDEVSLNPLAPTFTAKAIKYWAGEGVQVPQELIDSGDLRSCLFHIYMESVQPGAVMGVRDTNLTMFHALGRLFYPLKQKEANLWHPYLPDDRFLFHLYIHQNMLPFMANLEEAATVLDALSLDNYERSNVPLTEFTLSVLIGSEGRIPVKARPSFNRPEYLDSLKSHRRGFTHLGELL